MRHLRLRVLLITAAIILPLTHLEAFVHDPIGDKRWLTRPGEVGPAKIRIYLTRFSGSNTISPTNPYSIHNLKRRTHDE